MQIQVVNDFNHGGQVFSQAQINSFLADEQTAVNILQSTFTNNISVTFDIGYGSIFNQNTQTQQTLQNQSFSVGDIDEAAAFTLSYSQLRNDLLTFGQPGLFNAANLPAGNSINNVSNFYVSSSVGACFGLFTQATDGFVGIGTNFTPGAQRVSAFLHEIGHAMGRVPEDIVRQGTTYFSDLDLWRFTGQGNRLFDGTTNPSQQNPVQAAYFSLDGGATDLADWGQTSDPSDFRGPTSVPPSQLTPNDPFDEFVGDLGNLTTVDIQCMDALGFKSATAPVTNPPPPPGTTADMVLRHGADGLYEIYDIGGNSLLAAYQLGQVGTDWRFVTLNGFFGGDTTDMLLRNANSGGFEVYDISNNNITNAAFLGNVGLDWQVMGFGNFSSRGENDMILRNANNGGVEVYDLANNQITGAAFMGTVGLNWQFSGIGNFSGRGTSDMLLRNSNTGGLEVYDINSNAITGAAFIGTVGLDWQFSGVGNFSGVPGETDLLLRNSKTGGLEVYDINSNAITGAAFIGTVGLDWQFAGIAPIHAAGASDLVLRNVNTGAFEVYDIVANTLAGAASLSAVGTDWQLGGFAADPPTASAASMDGSSQVAQLTQAMAGFGGGSGGAGATLSVTTLGADTSQQALVTTPQPLVTTPQHA